MSEEIDRVAWAINTAWNEFGDVPFPLYQHEAEALAKAAIEAMPKAPAVSNGHHNTPQGECS